MTVTPNGDVYLCKTKLENDYKNQFTWANINTQNTYFNGTVQNTFSEYTYIKKDSTITVSANIDDIIGCNYLFYVNNGFTSKRYYCFITGMTYVNENTTRISIETDVFQTWYFQIQYNRCFVEREHVNDDTIGLHTVPENLETGDYLPRDYTVMNYGTPLAEPYYVCVAVTENLLDNTSGIFKYNNNYCGFQYMVIKDEGSLRNFLKKYNNAGKIDAIYSLFIIPGMFAVVNDNPVHWELVDNIYYTWVDKKEDEFEIKEITMSRPSELGVGNDLYTPKNNKLYTKQFMYILCDNQNGATATYDYEYFTNANSCKFKSIGAITPGCSIKTFPEDYKVNTYYAYCEGIMAGKLPIGGWYNDVYTNWLTQNGVNIGVSLLSSGLQLVAGIGLAIGTGGAGALMGTGSIANGALGIANSLGQVYEHSLAPNQAEGNLNGGDVNLAFNRIYPTYYRMTIKKEYAKIIDDYFTMFGYKVNTVKVPNITGRQNWNYVKTIDCNVDGDIPQSDLNTIKQMFNNGVTLWHNPANIYNYSLSNNII